MGFFSPIRSRGRCNNRYTHCFQTHHHHRHHHHHQTPHTQSYQTCQTLKQKQTGKKNPLSTFNSGSWRRRQCPAVNLEVQGLPTKYLWSHCRHPWREELYPDPVCWQEPELKRWARKYPSPLTSRSAHSIHCSYAPRCISLYSTNSPPPLQGASWSQWVRHQTLIPSPPSPNSLSLSLCDDDDDDGSKALSHTWERKKKSATKRPQVSKKD